MTNAAVDGQPYLLTQNIQCERAGLCVCVCISEPLLHAPLLNMLLPAPSKLDSFVLSRTLGKAFMAAVAVSLT